MWTAIIGFLGGPVIRGLLDAYNAKLKAGNVDNKIASDLAASEIVAQTAEIQAQTQYKIASLGRWYEPDKLMGYAVAIYFGKLLIWDKVLGLGSTDPLGMKDERHVPPAGQHFHDYNKSFRGHNFRRETDAARWVYDRLALHDKDDLPAGLSTKSYRGHMRYGIPAFTAQAKVDVPLVRSPAQGFGGRFRNGFRVPTDMTKLDDACGAIVAAKPLRDTVLVDTVNYRVVRLKEARKLGTFKLGEIKKVA